MKKEHILYEFVYDSLVTQIYRGSYHYGDYLPPFSQLCQEFGVSNITVRRAVRLMVDSHYLRPLNSKRFQVIFDILSPDYRESYLEGVAARKTAVLESYKVMELLLPACFVEGLRLCGEPELQALTDIVGEMNPWIQSLSELARLLEQFFSYPLKMLKNPILSDCMEKLFFFAKVSYLPDSGLPHPYGAAFMNLRKGFTQLLELIRERRYPAVKAAIRGYFARGYLVVKAYQERVAGDRQVEHQVPLHWYIDGRSPQLPLAFISELLWRIESGYYPAGGYLPAPPLLSQQFDLTESAVRKALAVLRRIGVVEIENGRGTRVLPHQSMSQRDLEDPAAQRIAATYIHALQFILITIGDLAEQALSGTDEAQLKQLEATLAGSRIFERQIYSWLLRLIPNHTLHRIGQQLLQAMTLGHFTNPESLSAQDPDIIGPQLADVAACLHDAAPQELARRLPRLYQTIYHLSRQRISAWGLLEEGEMVEPLSREPALTPDR